MYFPEMICAVFLWAIYFSWVISPPISSSLVYWNAPSLAQGLQLFLRVCTVAGMVEVLTGFLLGDIPTVPRAWLQINTWGTAVCLLRPAVIYL